MDILTALYAAKHYQSVRLPALCEAQNVLEAAGFVAEALSVEEYLIDQSDEAWEACGVKPY